MASARTGQTVSGAAQGAAIGSQILPGWGTAAGAVIGGIGGFISGGSADAQFSNQMAWAEYNRQSQYNVDKYNINSSLSIAGMNAAMGLAAGKYNAQQVINSAYYNAEMTRMTMEYNEDLLDNELTRVWQDLDLDITQIEMFRARERGNMIADQAASGTTIGQDSNALVVMDQQTQEALDITIVEFGADRQAANISNQIAQGRWQGEVAIQQTQWEGEVQANSIMFNSKVQAFGTVAGAVIKADADMYSSKQAYMTGGYNQEQAKATFGAQNQQAMVKGLFTAAATYGAGAYARKVPGTTAAAKTYTGPLSPTYKYNAPSGAGTSLITGGA